MTFQLQDTCDLYNVHVSSIISNQHVMYVQYKQVNVMVMSNKTTKTITVYEKYHKLYLSEK